MTTPDRPGHKYTMDDVAAEAGVSRTSVSRVLLGQNKVSEETRRRVRTAAHRMGYVPNVMASELASRASSTIGLLLRDAANPAYGMLFTELQKAAHAAGLTLVTMTISEDDRGQQQVASLHHLVGMRVAGLIVATGGITSEQLQPFQRRTPIVRAGRPESTGMIHAVSYDEQDAGRQLAEHIISLGHWEVAVLMTAESTSFPEFVRSTAMAAELTKQKIPVTPIPVTAPDDGVETAVRLTRAGAVTAIMCPSDLRQLAVLRGLRTAGLSVPNDVSVSGCDGIMPGLDLMGLTTLRLPVNKLAQHTINLMGRLVGEHPPTTITQRRLTGTLVPGNTAGPPKRHALQLP